MKKARQLQIVVVALALGCLAGNADWLVGMSGSSVLVGSAHVRVPDVGEHGIAWSTGSGGKGWSDMFM